MYIILGIGAAIMAFFATVIFVDQLITHGFLETVIPGGIAAYFTYQYFAKKDQEELERLLNPPPVVWPVSLPVAWGCVKDVLDRGSFHTGFGRPATWHIQKDDNSQGIVAAQLNFSQQINMGPTSGWQPAPRTIGVTVLFAPETQGTRVQISYSIFSPLGSGLARSIVVATHKAFQSAMNAHKGE